MNSEERKAVWAEKGATLSDKSARKEFGLTEEEIMEAIREGKLQYRENSLYGNPFFRLVRSEVEALVRKKYGTSHLEKKKIQTELVQVNKDLRMLKTKMGRLEKRKAELMASLDR